MLFAQVEDHNGFFSYLLSKQKSLTTLRWNFLPSILVDFFPCRAPKNRPHLTFYTALQSHEEGIPARRYPVGIFSMCALCLSITLPNVTCYVRTGDQLAGTVIPATTEVSYLSFVILSETESNKTWLIIPPFKKIILRVK